MTTGLLITPTLLRQSQFMRQHRVDVRRSCQSCGRRLLRRLQRLCEDAVEARPGLRDTGRIRRRGRSGNGSKGQCRYVRALRNCSLVEGIS